MVTEGMKVLEAAAGKFGFKLDSQQFDFGGDYYLRTGEVLPKSAVGDLRQFDAIYPGAIGHPDVKPGILEKGILLRLRFELDQYINLRPVERCLRYAFDYAARRGKKAQGRGEENTLGLVGKTNVLTYVFDLWERAFHEIGQTDYAEIRRDYYHIDAACMWMVKNPEWFDVLVTSNMFGDIITDLGAITQGGYGHRGQRKH